MFVIFWPWLGEQIDAESDVILFDIAGLFFLTARTSFKCAKEIKSYPIIILYPESLTVVDVNK